MRRHGARLTSNGRSLSFRAMRTQPLTYSPTAGMMRPSAWRLAIRLTASALVALLAVFAAWALWSPANAQSTCGRSFIQQVGEGDVYLVKTENGEWFKRLMLNPNAFTAYGCPWEDIRPVSKAVLGRYRTSTLGQVPGEAPVYLFTSTGTDSGRYQHLRMKLSELRRAGYDLGEIFSIRRGDRDEYTKGPDITCIDWDVCDQPSIGNQPPVISVRGPLTLTVGQQVTDRYVATVTDPDGTLSGESMSVYGLPGNGWIHTYHQSSGRLTVSGTVPTGTVGSRTATVKASDDGTTNWRSEQAFQITVVGDPVSTDNYPPVINVRGPLTLTAGQQVTDRYVATVTDLDDTLSGQSMSVYGLPGNGWTHAYDQSSGRLTISGAAPSGTVGGWTATVKASDDGTTNWRSEQAFQITVVGDATPDTPPPPPGTGITLDYDSKGGCQLSNADGQGQPSYRPGQEVLLSCPVTSTFATPQIVALNVSLRHVNTMRHPVRLSELKTLRQGTARQWTRFSLPSNWPVGQTTARVELLRVVGADWLVADDKTTEPFSVRAEVDYAGPFFIRATLSDSKLVAGDSFVVDLTVQCSATQSQRLWFIASLARAGELLGDADNDNNENQHECPAGQTVRIARAFTVPNNASPGEYLTRVTLADASVGKTERVIWYHGSPDIFPRDKMTLRIVPEIIDLPRSQPIPEPSFRIDLGEFAKGLAGEVGLWFFNSDCDQTFERMLGCLVWALNPVTDAIDTVAWLAKQCVINRLIRKDQDSCTLTDLGLTLLGIVPVVGDGAEIVGTLAKMARVDLDKMLALLNWAPFESLLNAQALSFLGGTRKIADDALASSFRRSLDDAVTKTERFPSGASRISVDNAELTRAAEVLQRQLAIPGLADAVKANPMRVVSERTETAADGTRYTSTDGFYGLFDLYRQYDDSLRVGWSKDASNRVTGTESHMKALAEDHRRGWRIKEIEWKVPHGRQRADTINELPNGTKIWQEVKTSFGFVDQSYIKERIKLAVDNKMDRFVLTVADEVRRTPLHGGLTEVESVIRGVAEEADIEAWVRYLAGPKKEILVFRP